MQTLETPGIINPECLYTVQELAERLGVTKEVVLSWRADGMPIHKRQRGKVMLIDGREFRDWYISSSQEAAAK